MKKAQSYLTIPRREYMRLRRVERQFNLYLTSVLGSLEFLKDEPDVYTMSDVRKRYR